MNQVELGREVKKYKARKLKTRASYYSFLLSLFLTISTLGDGLSRLTVTSFLLILPLPLYFFLQSLKLYHKNQYLQGKTERIKAQAYNLRTSFSLRDFLMQPNFAFRLSLLLFCLVCLTAIARVRTISPQIITYQINASN